MILFLLPFRIFSNSNFGASWRGIFVWQIYKSIEYRVRTTFRFKAPSKCPYKPRLLSLKKLSLAKTPTCVMVVGKMLRGRRDKGGIDKGWCQQRIGDNGHGHHYGHPTIGVNVLFRPLQTFLRKVVDLLVNNNRLWLIEGGTSPGKGGKGYCWMLQKFLHTFQLYVWLMVRHVRTRKKEMWSNKWARPTSEGVESLGGTVRLWRCLHWGEAMEATPIWEEKCQCKKSHHPLNNRPLDWEKIKLCSCFTHVKVWT